MRVKLFFAVCVVCFLAMPASAFAAAFTATAETATIDVGNVLVNFTVNENDAAIVQVNFTLPSGFSYYGGYQGSSSDGLFSPTPTPRWYNATTSNIVANDGDEKFWFKVTTPSTGAFPRSFNFNVSTTDVNGVFNSVNASVTVNDLSGPAWSSNFTSPSSPTAYVSNGSYVFNITWIDNVFLDEVGFEWDGTTNYTNTTSPAVQSIGSDKYSITLRDLPQDNYTYRWYADDENSVYNSTEAVAFNVTRASNPTNIYLNGNLNQHMIINDGETINATATGGSVILYRNTSVVANPYIDVLPIGYYEFKANSSGNRNYTVNATGVSYHLNVVYPAPRYSIVTSIPSVWYRNIYVTFNITWSDDNDANGFNTALIQLNHSGTATNYTMERRTGTNISTYELNLSRPMSLAWRVYANNSYETWNATPLTTAIIGKISPAISLTANPSWDVVTGTQTVVSCISDQVSVNLYRDGVLVSNPDLQTLGTGDYVYLCNNTATANYSTATNSSMLDVLRYPANISFVQATALITVKQNSSSSTLVIVKNVGNASHAVNFTIENITSTWYTLNATDVTLGVGEKVTFLVNFSISASAEIKDYTGQYKAGTIDTTITSDFILRVLPKEESQPDISNELALYRVNMTRVWDEIKTSKDAGVNVTLSEQKILEAKEQIELAESYIAGGDYFSAYQLFDSIKSLISAAETQLQSELESEEEEITEKGGLPNWTTWALAGIVIAVVGVLAYLFWPQPGYSPRTGKYTHKTPKERGVEAVSEAKKKIADKVSKPKPAYKSSFKEQSIKLSGLAVEQPITKRGKYTIQKPKAAQKISEKFSKIKNMLKRKRKYKEVELKETD